MNHTHPTVISDLIALGECGDAGSTLRTQILVRLELFERVNWLGWNDWSRCMEMLDEGRASNLVRGLTMAELLLKWSGGSAASVIWAFRVFQQRFPNSSDELADWILRHSDNPYAPFGTMRVGIRSISQFRLYAAAEGKRRIESEQAQERRRIQKQIRLAIKRRLVTERCLLQEAHRRARQELIELLEKLPIRNRLEHIAWDDFHSLAYYPSSFANVSQHEFLELDCGTRQRLLDKMSARRKGVWLRAAQRLLSGET